MGSELTQEKLVTFSKKLEIAFNDQKVGLTILKGMVEKKIEEVKDQYVSVVAFDKSCSKALDDKLEALRSVKPNKAVADTTTVGNIVDLYLQKLNEVVIAGELKSVRGAVSDLETELKSIKRLVTTLAKDAVGAGFTAAVAAFDKGYKKHSWSNLKAKAITAIKNESNQLTTHFKAYLSDCGTHLKKFEKVATPSFIAAIPLLAANDTPKGKAVAGKLREAVEEIKRVNKSIAASGYAGLLKKDFVGTTDKGLKFLESHL